MTTYSDAAATYVHTKITLGRHPLRCICVGCDDLCECFDAGVAHERATHTCPEPPHPDDAILEALDRMGYRGDVLADLRDEGFDIVRADKSES